MSLLTDNELSSLANTIEVSDTCCASSVFSPLSEAGCSTPDPVALVFVGIFFADAVPGVALSLPTLLDGGVLNHDVIS